MMTSRRGMPTSTTQHMADMIVHVYEPTCIHRMYDSHTPLVYGGGYGKMFGQRHSDTLNMVERSDSDQTKSPIKHTCLIGATPIKQTCLIGATPVNQHHVDMMICATTNLNCRINSDMM